MPNILVWMLFAVLCAHGPSETLSPEVTVFREGSRNILKKNSVILAASEQTTSPNKAPVSLNILVEKVTSSSVTFSWPPPSGAAEANVYLAPEPAESPEARPLGAVLAATVPGDAARCTVDKLAAAVDVFFRIEISGAENVIAAGNVHARTAGGPKALLDTPLREIHLYAPNVLQLVLANPKVTSFSGEGGSLEGYTGPQWQAGPWTVARKDGGPLSVVRVHRRSFPVGQPYYELGYGKNTHDELVDVDHHLFLELNEPVPNGEVLHIQGPLNLDLVLPFSDRYLETPVIQLNQIGYCPRATRRFAYVSGWLGDGGPLSLANFPKTAEVLAQPETESQPRAIVKKDIPIADRAVNDEDAGTEVREIDLSGVAPAEGTVYRIRIPGVGVSWPTQISETAVFKAFYTLGRGLYHNRWGRDLKPECTEWSPRPPDHPTVFTAELLDDKGNPLFGYGSKALFPQSTPKQNERTMIGGHHNAGDFDIQLLDHIVALLLLRLYELNPAAFTDRQLTLPESGNGIPDILDEALWSLAAWERLQEDDGGVRAGVESWREPWGIYYADQDPLPYWTYSRHTLHTLRVAGLFAQAARLVKPFDEAKSVELQKRAIRAYDYAAAHDANENSRGPILFAAGELFRLTGEPRYKEMFDAAWRVEDKYKTGPGAYAFLPDTSAYYEPKSPIMQDHLLGYLGGTQADPVFCSEAEKKMTQLADEAVKDVDTLHAHRNGRSLGPSWGRGTAAGEFVRRIYARAQLGNLPTEKWQIYFDAISLSADYALGANPEGRVWITQLGSRHPEDPLHLDSLAFIKDGKGPVPGFAVFGPTKGISGMPHYDFGKNVMYPPFLEHPLLRRYADLHTFVANNEGSCQTAALHTELFGMLLAPGMMPPASWLPGGKEHCNCLTPREAVIPAASIPPNTRTLSDTATATVTRPVPEPGAATPLPDSTNTAPSRVKDERLRRSLESRPGADGTNKYAPLRQKTP